MRERRRRRGGAVAREALKLSSVLNEVWSMHFVMDALARRLKMLTIVGGVIK